MLRPWTLVGFIGHRKLARPEVVAAAIGEILDRLASSGRRVAVISSIAIGGDTLFVRAALARGFPWVALLPMRRSDFKNDFTPEDWAEADSLLGRASAIREELWVPTRHDGYVECGVRAAEESDVLVAVWNGRPAAGRGGTGETVEYARGIGQPMFWIDPETGAVTEERTDALSAVEDAEPGNHSPRDGRSDVEETFSRLDKLAVQSAPEARQTLLRVLLLHLVAASVGLSSLVLRLESWPAHMAVVIKVFLLLRALNLTLRMRHAREAWRSARIGAELCRSALATWDLPNRAGVFPKVHVPGFESLQRSLHFARLSDRPDGQEFIAVRDGYLQRRVTDQKNFFQSRLAAIAPREKWVRRTALACTIAAIAAGLTLLAAAVGGLDLPNPKIVRLVALTLPLANAALLSYLVASDTGRRAQRYAEIVRVMEDAAGRLGHARTWGALERIVVDTERALIHEVLEWHSVSRYAAKVH